MTIITHNNQLPKFDYFKYFKKHFYKQEGIMYHADYDGIDLAFDVRTKHFYKFYIVNFGYEFIERKISLVKDEELRTELCNFFKYSKDFEKYVEKELKSFCEAASISFDEIGEIKSIFLLNSASELNNLLSQIRGQKRYEELAAIAIAYFFYDGVSEDTAENFWYHITQHFCNELGTDMGLKECAKIYSRANDILYELDEDIRIPDYDDYPKALNDGESEDFIDTYQKEYADRQVIGYNHIHIGKQTFNKEYMQLFPLYACYRKRAGRNFIDESKINDEDFLRHCKLYDFIYVNYYNEECHRFKDFLSMMDCEFLYEKLSTYVPVSFYTIDSFIRKNYDRNIEYSMERYAALLLIYWLYDKEDLSYSDTLYVHSILHKSISIADSFSRFPVTWDKSFKINIANDIIEEANQLGDKLNLPIIPKAQTPVDKYKESGSFSLPWKYVTFNNGYLLLSHPLADEKSKFQAYRLDLKGSKFAYNAIKLYFSSNVPLLKVHSHKNRITKVENLDTFDLEKYVEAIAYRTNKRKKIEINRRVHPGQSHSYRAYTLSEVCQDPLVQKSYYLNELCKMHLQQYKVYQCNELRSNATTSTTESVFCFVVKEYDDQLILAVENTLDSRSTIIFYIKKALLIEALSTINQFFSSNEINKRQSLQWHDVDFKDASIVKYKRIIHTSIYDWKHAMKCVLSY